MIPTCLKGEALVVYKSVGNEERKNYETVKEALQNAISVEDHKFIANVIIDLLSLNITIQSSNKFAIMQDS